MQNYKKITLDKAERAKWGNAGAAWFLTETDQVNIAERVLSPGIRELKHYHEKSWQFFYVISGSGVIIIDNEEIPLASEEAIEVPAGAAHQMLNDTDIDLRFLIISIPDSRGDRVEVD